MLANYLRTAVRALSKQKLHLGLNLFGLSVGLAATLLLLLWLHFELSFDRFQPQAEQTYRLTQTFVKMDEGIAVSSPLLTNKLKDHIPAIKDATQLVMIPGPLNTVKIASKPYRFQHLMAADQRLLHFFNFKVLAGSLTKTLASPGGIALSKRQALRLFGQTQVIGHQLQWQNQNLTVTAVFADLPNNTHLEIQGLTSIASLRSTRVGAMLDRPNFNLAYNYLRIPNTAAVPQLEKQIAQTINGLAYKGKPVVTVTLQPLLAIHLHSQLMGEMKANGSADSVWMGFGLMLFLLLLACFNFINLSTARSSVRAKEVGVRKALGASRGQLIVQFLIESVMLTALATLLACVWVELSLPLFNQLMNSHLVLHYNGMLAWLLPSMVIIVGVLAGIYPAFYLSAFNPARVLGGDLIRGQSSIWLRKALVWLQGAVSIGLVICTWVFFAQIQFDQSRPLGWHKSGVVTVPRLSTSLYQHQGRLRTALSQIPGIKSWSLIDQAPTKGLAMFWPADANGHHRDYVGIVGASFDLVKTLQMQLLAGRDFERRFAADRYNPKTHKAGLIINDAARRQMGFLTPQDAIGKPWKAGGSVNGTIVGVVANLKLGANTEAVKPMCFVLGATSVNSVTLLVRLKDGGVLPTVQQLRSQLQRLFPQQVIDTHFLNEDYQALFDQQRRQQHLLAAFSSLAIVLTCVGLFGLAAFSCERRAKEIAVRKVLGANRRQLVLLLSQEFLVLVLAASLLAWPVSWWLMHRWLTHFPDRISVSPLWFPLATLAMMAIAGATVAVLALKAAASKPALTLRYE